ncbi:winged helix DNA-binding protein [Sphingomonas sp. BIUV-7]|uniref:Winged helix DNA-binding protein n=1 Tax=Sphingomonas natans TaxID=3063330 RepID=A0ABT8Y5A8_9SPHN|nr:winged helix DNA-binding protein [Sphingomonas sp. BIUV-7]MDO6413509.1 winged helix DNA-binding protein [Sphingomonas sp. BIUV-7]
MPVGLADSYRSSPSILLFADSPAGFSEQERAISGLDGRIAGSGPVGSALARIDEACDIGVVVVDASRDDPALDRLLDRLDLAARDDRFMSLVTVTPDLIDLAAARCPHPHVVLQCGASEVERVAALALALAGAARVPQLAGELGHARLKQLSEEVGRIAQTLAALSESDALARPLRRAQPDDDGSAFPDASAAMIRGYIRARRLREHYFSAELFADPAWDMLLDLMAARIEGRTVAVSSLCIAAAVPATTGLRWIKTLTDEGLFVRVDDPQDGRRVFIELSETAAAGMTAYFHALQRAGLTGI